MYDQYAAMILRVAARVTGNRAAAEDLVQDVLVFLWERPQAFDPDRGRLRAWLAMLAHRRSVDWVRREIRRRELVEQIMPDQDGGPAADEAVIDADVAARVRNAIARLPSPQRMAVELAYFQERTYRQVAVDLGIPEGTVKSRIRAALRTISAAVTSEEVR